MKPASCLLPMVLLALPLAVSARIYTWTDERGTTVFSNRPPAAETKVSNLEVVAEDDELGAAPRQAAAPKPDNGNALQERVRALEQQVQALQTPPSGYAPPYSVQLPAAQLPSPMYTYGYPYLPYAYPSYVVVAPGQFSRPAYGSGGFHFGVHPVPVTHVMGFTQRP